MAALLILGLLVSGLSAPQALSAFQGGQTSSYVVDCPGTGGGEGHHGHHSAHSPNAEDPAAVEDCGPVACCPADRTVAFVTPRQPELRALRTFGPESLPLPAPDTRRDRPPRLA